jgi:serine/threonine-protein kinase
VSGSDLAASLSAGPLPRQRTLSILEQVGSGLDAVHAEGLVHRDIKPGNILLQGDHAYVNDFGLAKRTGPNGPGRARGRGITRAGDIVGTLDYMAPEQVEGKDVGPGTDIYALGCIMYHCLTGAPPFVRDNDVAVMYAHMQQPPPSVTAARGDLPVEVDGVIARAMAKRRDERFESCGEFADALRDALKLSTAAETGPLVLVATAEDAIRLLIHGALAVHGFRVVEEDDPTRMAERAQEIVPDLVIAQWAELGDLADDLFRQIRSDPRTTRARLIAIGPRAAPTEMCTAMRDHVDDYLMRPFSPVHLLIKVGDLRAARSV